MNVYYLGEAFVFYSLPLLFKEREAGCGAWGGWINQGTDVAVIPPTSLVL